MFFFYMRLIMSHLHLFSNFDIFADLIRFSTLVEKRLKIMLLGVIIVSPWN